MARILNSSVTGISGKVGNLVFFRRNGKSFVKRAGIRKIDMSPSGIARREKFAMCVKLAKCINRIPEVKALWDKHKAVGGSAYQVINKHNYHRTDGNDIFDVPEIVPDSVSFNKSSETVSVISDTIRFKLNLDEISGISRKDLKENTIIAGVLFFLDNLSYSKEQYIFVSVKGSIVKSGKSCYAGINLPFYSSQYFKDYSTARLYFALVCGEKGVGNFMRLISR